MISVIVIGRNEGSRLSACLQSVQDALAVLSHEIIYVDSCSADDSLDRAKALGARCYLLAEQDTTAGLGRFAGAREAREMSCCSSTGTWSSAPASAKRR